MFRFPSICPYEFLQISFYLSYCNNNNFFINNDLGMKFCKTIQNSSHYQSKSVSNVTFQTCDD